MAEELSEQELTRPAWLIEQMTEMSEGALQRRYQNGERAPFTAILAREELVRRGILREHDA